MKSVFLVASFPESLINFRGELIDEFLSHGLRVHAIAPGLKEGTRVCEELQRRGVVPHHIAMQRNSVNPLFDLVTFLHLLYLMLKVKPDAVLAYTIKPVIYATLAARIAQVPKRFALITGLGFTFQDGHGVVKSLVGGLSRGLYRLAMRFTSKVFFQNPEDECLFRSKKFISGSMPSVVLNGSGVDIDKFCVAPLPGKRKFLFIGRLLVAKGIREYVQAAARIRRLYPECEFGVVGWIDEGPDSIPQQELDDWVESGTIEYLGRLADVRPALAESSVFVLPSYREGTPRTVLEAMAMSRAIITTDAPGCRETVIDGENGFLIPVKAVDELVSAMLKFIDNPDLVHRMGTCSRQIAESKYDVHKVNACMLNEMGIL